MQHVVPVLAFSIRLVVDHAEVLACGFLGNLPDLAGQIDASGVIVRGGDDGAPTGSFCIADASSILCMGFISLAIEK